VEQQAGLLLASLLFDSMVKNGGSFFCYIQQLSSQINYLMKKKEYNIFIGKAVEWK
jgi:hypothetical protein